MKNRLQIGEACEKDWQLLYSNGDPRPYGERAYIIRFHADRASDHFGIEITERMVASYWTAFRKQGRAASV